MMMEVRSTFTVAASRAIMIRPGISIQSRDLLGDMPRLFTLNHFTGEHRRHRDFLPERG
jgi:hypothetical protein